MIKLIASDLDGTLLQNGAQTVSEQAIQLIEKLLDNGIHFTAASGRQYNNLRRLFAPLPIAFLTLQKMVLCVFIMERFFPAPL